MRKLNIACGYTILPDYENADINTSIEGLDFYCDMTRIPQEDESYEEVFAAHCIEHLPIERAKEALAEWYRVLKVGGSLVVDTPFITRNISLYLNGGWQADFAYLTPDQQQRCSLNGVPNACLWLNFKVYSSPIQYDIHFAGYDIPLLSEMLLDTGFSSVCTIQTEPSLMVRAIK
jgi:hypothetical protein